MPEESNFRA